jgi:hypothetical protein
MQYDQFFDAKVERTGRKTFKMSDWYTAIRIPEEVLARHD